MKNVLSKTELNFTASFLSAKNKYKTLKRVANKNKTHFLLFLKTHVRGEGEGEEEEEEEEKEEEKDRRKKSVTQMYLTMIHPGMFKPGTDAHLQFSPVVLPVLPLEQRDEFNASLKDILIEADQGGRSVWH